MAAIVLLAASVGFSGRNTMSGGINNQVGMWNYQHGNYVPHGKSLSGRGGRSSERLVHLQFGMALLSGKGTSRPRKKLTGVLFKWIPRISPRITDWPS